MEGLWKQVQKTAAFDGHIAPFPEVFPVGLPAMMRAGDSLCCHVFFFVSWASTFISPSHIPW